MATHPPSVLLDKESSDVPPLSLPSPGLLGLGSSTGGSIVQSLGMQVLELQGKG